VTKQAQVGIGVVGVGLLGLIIYSTMQQAAIKVEVCVSFKGRAHCATAAGRTRDEAVATGQQIGCSLVTSGRDENMACLALAPASVRHLK
jgi:hypothetical protein